MPARAGASWVDSVNKHMDDSLPLLQQERREGLQCSDVSKGGLDLLVLKYMARRLHIILPQLNHASYLVQPLLCTLQERHGRKHRIAIYNYQELFLARPLLFVGFISRRQEHLCPSVVNAIQEVDRQLLEELVDTPGLLSYSSLELRNGEWCNLVLMLDAEAKVHIKSTQTHTYAAHKLAYRYYRWIRLHNGMMPKGLDYTEMTLQKTREYTFEMAQQSTWHSM
jgi:hypothetical protein